MNRNSWRQHQQGSTLLISLLMLIVLTLLATSGMRTSVVEKQMASNASHYNVAFQASESAAEAAYAVASHLTTVINGNSAVTFDDVAALGSSNVKGSVDLEYLGTGLAPGYSAGVNQGSFVAHRFRATAVGQVEVPNGNGEVLARVTSSQGAYRVAPGGLR